MSKIEKAQGNIKKLYELINEPSFPIPEEMQALHWAYIAVNFLTAVSILDKKGPHFTGPILLKPQKDQGDPFHPTLTWWPFRIL